MAEEMKKQQLHLYCTDTQWDKITTGLEKLCNTESGKIRAGDLLRNILLDAIKNNVGKI